MFFHDVGILTSIETLGRNCGGIFFLHFWFIYSFLYFFCSGIEKVDRITEKDETTGNKIIKKMRKVCGQEKASSRQAQAVKYRFLHFSPLLLNLTVVFHRMTAFHTWQSTILTCVEYIVFFNFHVVLFSQKIIRNYFWSSINSDFYLLALSKVKNDLSKLKVLNSIWAFGVLFKICLKVKIVIFFVTVSNTLDSLQPLDIMIKTFPPLLFL